ncbi:hypothetical protein COLO4_24692 [Corchorus olitorius]|uniref:Uncharacterized protein n=1 Tax=Corchorus olitorius TaxID=93759 RepID=A0A1R3I7V4_9ROSI|nr:hypothetical protein COLO4_24692 [Corchorus olitorius]
MGPCDGSHSRETRIILRSKSKQIPFGKTRRVQWDQASFEERMSKRRVCFLGKVSTTPNPAAEAAVAERSCQESVPAKKASFDLLQT